MTHSFFGPSRRKLSRRSNRGPFRPAVEALEDRRLLATFSWFQIVDGTFGDLTHWHDQNGLPGLPGPNDDTSLPAGINVTSALPRTVNSLTSSAHFEISGGTFALKNVGHDSMLSGLILDSRATLRLLGGTTYLVGSTIAGTIDVAPGATLRFLRGDNNLNAGASLTDTGQYLVEGDTSGAPSVHLNTNLTAPAHFLLRNGVLDGTGMLTISGTFDWVSGGAGGASMAGTGVTKVQAGGTLHIGGTNGVTLDTRTINNAGTVKWDGTSNWAVANGTFNNLAGGTFNALTDQNVGFGGVFTNAGTFTKTSPVGTGTTFFDSIFNNTGTVSVQSGVLQLNRGGTATGGFTVGSTGQLFFSGSTYTLNNGASFAGQGLYHVGGADLEVNGNVTAANVTFDGGTIGGSAALAVSGTLGWSAGSMAGTGSTLIQSGATLNLSGSSDKNVTARALSNGGTVNWTGMGNWGLGGTFNNLAGATFNAQTDANIGSGGVFNNTGTFIKTSTVGTGATFIDSTFNDAGAVSVQSGVLQLNRGGTAAGSFDVAATGQLQFVGNIYYTLNGGATLTGAGTARVSGGQLTLAGDASAVNLGLDSGTLGGAAKLTITGTFDWTGGQIANANGSIALPSGSTLAIHGNNDKSFGGGTMNLAGTATWQDNGALNVSGGATLNVLAGGSFTIGNAKNVSGQGTITVAGTLTKSGSPGTTALTFGVAFNNNGGVVQVQTGTLSVGGDFIQNSGSTTVAAGAALAANGTVNIAGGLLAGSGMVSGKLSNGGIVSPGGAGSTGILTVVGSYTQTASGTLNLEIGGTSAGTQYDQLQVMGAATFAGTLDLSILNNFVPNVGNSFAVVPFASHSGDFASENGLTQGARHFDPGFTTTGLNLLANSTDTNQRFIVHLYSDLLGRAPDATGMSYWSSLLAAGLLSRYQITQAFTHSLEYRIDLVVGVYGQVLHRAPDPAGLSACVNYLQAGGFVEQLAAVLSGSAEYYQNRAGGTNDGFLDALYHDALGRAIDAQSRAAWDQVLAGGTTLAQVATAIYSSHECDLNTARVFYQTFLHRSADTGGMNALAGAIAHGAHDEDVIALLLATDEYFNRT
jgi:hypothetical protein